MAPKRASPAILVRGADPEVSHALPSCAACISRPKVTLINAAPKSHLYPQLAVPLRDLPPLPGHTRPVNGRVCPRACAAACTRVPVRGSLRACVPLPPRPLPSSRCFLSSHSRNKGDRVDIQMTSHRGLTRILIDLPLRLPFQVTLTCHTAAGDCQEVGFFFMDILRGHQQLPALASVGGRAGRR